MVTCLYFTHTHEHASTRIQREKRRMTQQTLNILSTIFINQGTIIETIFVVNKQTLYMVLVLIWTNVTSVSRVIGFVMKVLNWLTWRERTEDVCLKLQLLYYPVDNVDKIFIYILKIQITFILKNLYHKSNYLNV